MVVYCKLHLSNVGPCSGFQILDVSIKKPKTQGFGEPSMLLNCGTECGAYLKMDVDWKKSLNCL